DHEQHDGEEFIREPVREFEPEPVREAEPEPKPAGTPGGARPQRADEFGFRAAGAPAPYQSGGYPQHPSSAAPSPAGRNDDWFWWTDGASPRHVSHVPERPDLPKTPPAWGATPSGPWTPHNVEWTSPGVPRHARRRGRAGAIVAGFVAAAVLIASGIGIGWGL